MPRRKIQNLTEKEKQDLDAGLVKFPNSQGAGHILGRRTRKTIKEWVRLNKYGLADIAIPIGGDFIFEYSDLVSLMIELKGNDPKVTKRVLQSVV